MIVMVTNSSQSITPNKQATSVTPMASESKPRPNHLTKTKENVVASSLTPANVAHQVRSSLVENLRDAPTTERQKIFNLLKLFNHQNKLVLPTPESLENIFKPNSPTYVPKAFQLPFLSAMVATIFAQIAETGAKRESDLLNLTEWIGGCSDFVRQQLQLVFSNHQGLKTLGLNLAPTWVSRDNLQASNITTSLRYPDLTVDIYKALLNHRKKSQGPFRTLIIGPGAERFVNSTNGQVTSYSPQVMETAALMKSTDQMTVVEPSDEVLSRIPVQGRAAIAKGYANIKTFREITGNASPKVNRKHLSQACSYVQKKIHTAMSKPETEDNLLRPQLIQQYLKDYLAHKPQTSGPNELGQGPFDLILCTKVLSYHLEQYDKRVQPNAKGPDIINEDRLFFILNTLGALADQLAPEGTLVVDTSFIRNNLMSLKLFQDFTSAHGVTIMRESDDTQYKFDDQVRHGPGLTVLKKNP